MAFEGTIRTPTVVSGGRHREVRLVAPFYDRYIYPSPGYSHPFSEIRAGIGFSACLMRVEREGKTYETEKIEKDPHW